MAIDKEIKDYIDSVIKNLQVDTLAVGSFDEEAQVGSRAQGSQRARNTLIAGVNNQAKADHSAAIGSNNEVGEVANSAMALGEGTIAGSKYQLVQGKYNDPDYNNIYAHMVGNGIGPNKDDRKNIYTLDWEGNAWFAGDILTGDPSKPDKLVTEKHLVKNIPIKVYPHTEKNNLISICVNDLEPYTIYKVDTSGEYNRVEFVVKNDQGREIKFLSTDSNVNKYNMFVSTKTNDVAILSINSVMYELDLHTGKYKESYDNKFAAESNNSESTSSIDIIDDKTTDPNKTWSSYELAKRFSSLSDALEEAYNRVELELDEGGSFSENKATLIFYKDDMALAEIDLSPSYFITEDDVMRWNSVQGKLNKPGDNGDTGQVLALKEITVDENGDEHLVTEWVQKDDVEINLLTREEIDSLKSIFAVEKDEE